MMPPVMPGPPHPRIAAGSSAEAAGSPGRRVSRRTAAVSLLLLLAINLFNYVDRQALSAAEPNIRQDILHEPASAGSLPSTAPSAAGHAKTRTGTIAAAFVLSYTFLSPLFGWLADRASRWLIVGTSVILWSLASGGSGLAATF